MTREWDYGMLWMGSYFPLGLKEDIFGVGFVIISALPLCEILILCY